MYNDEDLLEKEVIDSNGTLLGTVLEVTIRNDIPCIVVGKKKLFASKSKILDSTNTVLVPYYEISSLDDTIMLKKSLEEIKEQKNLI